MQTPFRVVVADPAWKFKDKLPGPKRGAVKHYKSVMTDGEVLAYLPGLEMNREVELAQDCVLFLWRVSAMGSLAYLVLKTWGFVEKSEAVWIKLTKHGKRHFGMGRSVRMAHESALIGHRGHPKRLSASIRSVFEAKMPYDERGTIIHSAKPDEFYALVEKLYPGPYLELFARRCREGWTTMGNELV